MNTIDPEGKHRAEEESFNRKKRERAIAARSANMVAKNGNYLAPEHRTFNQEYPFDGPNAQSTQYTLGDDGQPVSIDPRSMQEKFERDMDHASAEDDGVTFGGKKSKSKKSKKSKSKKSKKSKSKSKKSKSKKSRK